MTRVLQRIGDKGLAWENKGIVDLSTELVLTMLKVQLIENYGRSISKANLLSVVSWLPNLAVNLIVCAQLSFDSWLVDYYSHDSPCQTHSPTSTFHLWVVEQAQIVWYVSLPIDTRPCSRMYRLLLNKSLPRTNKAFSREYAWMRRVCLVIITFGNSGYEFIVLISTFMEHKPKKQNAFCSTSQYTVNWLHCMINVACAKVFGNYIHWRM